MRWAGRTLQALPASASRCRRGGQATTGAELLVLASGLGGALWWLNRRAMAQPSAQPISRILRTVSPDAITTIVLAAAGVLLLAGVDDGVYVVVPAMIAVIIGGVASAWLFLIRITA